MLARHPLVGHRTQVLAGRQVPFLPARQSSFEMRGLDAFGTQRLCRTLTAHAALAAVSDDRSTEWQFLHPIPDVVGRTMERADDQAVVGAERILVTNIDQQRRRCGAEMRKEVVWSNREKISIHVSSPQRL